MRYECPRSVEVVAGFHGLLGIDDGRESVEARRWVEAATEAKDRALETGADGVDTVRRVGGEALDRAKSVKGKLSSSALASRLSSTIAERASHGRGD